jgi:uncharacterized protein (DUF1330 family)
MLLTLCCLLWAHPGRESDVVEFEDRVLAFLPDHGARLVSRVRSDGSVGHPLEVQLFEFPSQESLNAYLADPRRIALSAERDSAVAKTELMTVDRI